MNLLRICVSVFLLLAFSKTAYACVDGCLPNPRKNLFCYKHKSFFGAYTENAILYNYTQYDLIFIAESVWSYKDLYKYKEDNKFNRKRVSVNGVPTYMPYPKPYRVIEIFKKHTRQELPSGTELLLMNRNNLWDFYLRRMYPDGRIRKERVCYNPYSLDQSQRLLIFAKKHYGIKEPVIVRMTPISDNIYNETLAEKADFVISGFVKNETLKGPKGNKYRETDYQVLEIKKPGFDQSHITIDGVLTLDITDSAGSVLVASDYPQLALFYFVKSKERQSFYEVIAITGDIQNEIDTLREIYKRKKNSFWGTLLGF